MIPTALETRSRVRYITELQEMIPFESGLQSFLVLSASAKYEDMKQVLKQFSGVPVNQFIFTKTDETASLGSVFQVLSESRIGAAYLTNGQDVPEDILSASPKEFGATAMFNVKLDFPTPPLPLMTANVFAFFS